jgi:hypothetical protein
MRSLLVTGLGFHEEKVLRPLEACGASGILMVYGDHDGSREVESRVRSTLPSLWVRSVAVPDWDLRTLALQLMEATQDAVQLMGGRRRCRPIVNLSAGHGFLHVCLAHLAREEGLQMVYWREATEEAVFSSPFEMGTRDLQERPSQVLRVLHQDGPGTARSIGRSTGLATSTVYHALQVLEWGGLLERSGRGVFRPTAAGAAWFGYSVHGIGGNRVAG